MSTLSLCSIILKINTCYKVSSLLMQNKSMNIENQRENSDNGLYQHIVKDGFHTICHYLFISYVFQIAICISVLREQRFIRNQVHARYGRFQSQ